MSLTILHLNTERGLRGGEFQMLLLAGELQKRGHKNILLLQNNSRAAQEAISQGLERKSFGMRGEWDLMAAARIRSAIRQYQPQILHAHTAHAGTLALFARGKRKAPAIVLSRRVALPLKRNALVSYKHRSVDALIAVSNWIKTQLVNSGLPQDRIFVAESGTDFSKFEKSLSREEARSMLDIPPHAFVIGNIGHIESQKGQLFLIQVFSQLVRKNQSAPFYLIFVGAGPGMDECRSFVNQLNISDRVIFTGFHLDVENYYPAMDVFFLPTLPRMGEGWSGVIREANAARIPVIAVRQESIAEQVQDGQTGLLVDFDDLPGWIAAIEKIQHSPGLKQSLAEKASEYVRQFTVERMADKTEECYRAVLARYMEADNPR